jgi:hypothetical protein
MRRKLIVFLLLVITASRSLAQQAVGIGINTPHASSLLHLNSTSKGLLLPSMTEAQRTSIVNPANGLLVFQSDGEDGLYINKSPISTLPIWSLIGEGKATWGPASGNSDNIRNLFSGGVVIGTTSLAQCAKLQITSTTSGLLFPRMSSVQRSAIPSPINGLMVYDNTLEKFFVFQDGSWRYLINDDYWIRSGNRVFNVGDSVGLNIVTPTERLDIGGNMRAYGAKFNMTSQNPQVDFLLADVPKAFIQLSGTTGDNLRLGTISGNSVGKFIVRTNGGDRMFVDGSGNVSIGTPDVAAGYRLNVLGKIISEEIRVELKSAWPDYVFSNKYQLTPLSEVEAFIQKENHLPNIPSAEEVEKNGLHLGSMQTKMMEKIEELTLYIIEINKRIEALEKENKLLQQKSSKQ